MPSDPASCALRTPGHLSFASTQALADTFGQSGERVVVRPTGHLVLYRPDGRRFLATDPSGHPLHECDWQSTAYGTVSLARARIRLDWGRWIGLKPCGLVSETRLNLARKPGWQRITPDDLCAMAAQALRVPIEEVRWFFRDEDVSIDGTGMATIRQKKDAFYVLEDGTFESARFMACMGAMHWDRIDFLPVVELFKSLLPGTGSAVFELIRGLYDDQNEGLRNPRPLRYRGIPTYPSKAAFRLFSSFFTPAAPPGEQPLECFMDQSRSHHVTWLPVDSPPVRYFDDAQGVCLTVQGGVARKATVSNDSAGVSYSHSRNRSISPLDRRLRVEGNQLILTDREQETLVPLWRGIVAAPTPSEPIRVSPIDWRTLFTPELPPIRPSEAFGAVLLYPDGEEDIGELPAQPFVADFVQDLGEQDREIGTILSRAERVLIDNGDAVIATCVSFEHPCDYRIRTIHPAHAQRQAQELWMRCADMQQWDRLKRVRIVPAAAWEKPLSKHQAFDVVYQWLSYDSFEDPVRLAASLAELKQVLRSGGHVFLTGPISLGDLLPRHGLNMLWEESVASLPTFQMHKTILPTARVKNGLTLFFIERL